MTHLQRGNVEGLLFYTISHWATIDTYPNYDKLKKKNPIPHFNSLLLEWLVDFPSANQILNQLK